MRTVWDGCAGGGEGGWEIQKAHARFLLSLELLREVDGMATQEWGAEA